MNLGLLPGLGGGLASSAASGQIDRLLRYYLPAYRRAFERIHYFSYLPDDALDRYTADPDLLAAVTVRPKRSRAPHPLYALQLPQVAAAELRACHVLRVFHTTGAIPALIARLRFGIPYVTTYGYEYHEFARIDGRRTRALLWQRLEPLLLRHAARVIVPTEELAAYAARFVPPERIARIPNGVETARFVPAAIPPRADPPIVLFVGRLTAQKNLPRLLEAVARMQTRVQLHLIGGGALRDALAAQATALGIDARFLGVVPHLELPAHLAAASVFALPSLTEGHPKALIEAMSCALPSVASDCDGNRRLVRHGETGLLVAPGDVPGLARSLDRLLLDRACAARLGAGARRHVVETLDIHPLLDREVALLRAAAESPR
jgi:glycosyltransferase involved in cell wall biosynthesis